MYRGSVLPPEIGDNIDNAHIHESGLLRENITRGGGGERGRGLVISAFQKRGNNFLNKSEGRSF